MALKVSEAKLRINIEGIEKLDKLDREEAPMKVEVEENNVTVTRGNDTVKTSGHVSPKKTN